MRTDGGRVDGSSEEEAAEAITSIVEGARRISIVQLPGRDPEVFTPDEWMEWELYATLMRAAEISGGEE